MITGNEPIYPILKNRQEWEDRSDGDSLGLGHYTVGGLELKHHMMIEFTKAILSGINSNSELYDVYMKTAKGRSTTVVECIAQLSDEYATALIKQFNK